jgi:endogenous inhibitor of DNA gyrase (YacG/DUF329 family)
MAIVECPSCKQEVDLGSLPKGRESETYGCPHCDQELDWTDQDEFKRINSSQTSRANRKSNAFLNSLEPRHSEKNFEFPLLVGNFKARWKIPSFIEIIMILLLAPFVIGAVVKIPFLLLLIPIKILYDEFKRLKYRKEFEENTLNPEYLKGTGLGILPDLSAVLIAKRRVPSYVFEKEDITRIVLHEETYHSSATVYELHVYLHGFHALTIYGFDEGDSKNIVGRLLSLYDIDFQYTSHYNAPDTSGGGGG